MSGAHTTSRINLAGQALLDSSEPLLVATQHWLTNMHIQACAGSEQVSDQGTNFQREGES